MKSNKERIDIKVNFKKLGLFLLFLLAIFTFTASYISINNPTSAATFPSFYFFANSNKADISSGWGTTIAIETSQAFPANSTLRIDFPDNTDGEWCRTAGSLSIVPVSSAPPDNGSINIDQAMPGTLIGNCTQGVGAGSNDTITINGVGPLTSGLMYGVEIQGNVGVLGTNGVPGGNDITITLQNGATNDNGLFIFALAADHSVTISATVLPAPQCDPVNGNDDCSYPLEICGQWDQCVPCDNDDQCNFGDVCIGGACTEDLSCSVPTDCDYGGETCVSNLCDDCTQDSHCLPGDRCRNGDCEPIPPAECTVNADCNYGREICDANRECNPCTTDNQCNSGDLCTNNVCTTPPPFECTSNSQCEYGNEICDGAGQCNPCITDWECNTGDACVNNVCTAKFQCLTNDDCRFPNEVCTTENQCAPCTIDQECGQGNICNDGLCEAEPPDECTTNEQCGYPYEVCGDGLCLICDLNHPCNNEDICIEGTCEPFPPDECTENDHCNYPGNICNDEPDPNICEPCEDDDQCDFGDECKSGRCVGEDSPEQLIPVSVSDIFSNLLTSISTTASNLADNLNGLTNSGAVATTISLIVSAGVGASLLNVALMDTPVLFTRGILGLLTLLGIRLKGQPYGYVYNAISKEPLSNAMVRVFTEKSSSDDRRRLVATSVTDAFGVFNAELKPGSYSMVASKSGYRFPSRIVVSMSDYPIDKVYHGDPFDLDKEGEVYYSIPIDPYKQGIFRTISAILRERFFMFAKFIQITITIFGAILSLYLFVTNPGIINTVIMLLYIPSIVVSGYLMRKKPPKYGSVVDSEGKGIENVTVGLFDEKEQRFLTKRVTDELGKFRFIAPDGEYHCELLDEPYEIVNEVKHHFRSSKNQDLIVIASDLTVERKEIESDYPMSDEKKESDQKEKDASVGNEQGEGSDKEVATDPSSDVPKESGNTEESSDKAESTPDKPPENMGPAISKPGESDPPISNVEPTG